MAMLVGAQEDFAKALFALCELDFDAVEAYDAAIARLENEDFRYSLSQFKQDHQLHIEELQEVLLQRIGDAPKSPSMKQWLTKGKVVLATLVGDKMILRAMLSNEEETNSAYQRMYERKDKWLEAEDIIRRGFSDERGHKQWLEKALATFF